MRHGEFERHSRKTLRLNKAAQGSKMFAADELRKTIHSSIFPWTSRASPWHNTLVYALT
jgi:hypothetical protein